MKAASRKGFTLIEILIVVIILGILAAIVIPQFANASQDAKLNSVKSTVQSVRGQVGLYALQHGDMYPTADGKTGAFDWTSLTIKTTFDGKTWGPYLQSIPTNPFDQSTAVSTFASGTPTTGGWGFEGATGKFYGGSNYGSKASWVGDNN